MRERKRRERLHGGEKRKGKKRKKKRRRNMPCGTCRLVTCGAPWDISQKSLYMLFDKNYLVEVVQKKIKIKN